MSAQIKALQLSKATEKIAIANCIIILIFMLIPYTEPLTTAANFLQYKIANSCTAGSWIKPQHALSIVASMTFSTLMAIFFAVFGAFTENELKRERNGGNVILACTLIAALVFYTAVFYLPCGISPHHEAILAKARLGEQLFNYVRVNSLIFILLLSFCCSCFFYGAALGLKLIKDGK